ncbi:MAG: hypothetical protein GX328_04145 [Clostridiaceae bacterium]|nr:hypothetical protein [Clostridiaceae bacterium]
MRKVYLIDPNQKYAEKLQKQLNPKLKPIAKIELLVSPAELKENFDLIIVHTSYFFDQRYLLQLEKIENQKIIRLDNTTVPFDVQASDSNSNESDFLVLSRRTTIAEWLHWLILKLDQMEQRIDIRQNKIHLLFTFNQHVRHQFCQKWLIEQNSEGNKIFVLPLKPLYLWNYQADFHAGPNLSDLVLQIEQDIEITEKDLGLIFEKQKSGIFLSRGNSAADDIFTYEHQSIQTIGKLFNKFIIQHEKSSVGLIDVEAGPFRLVKDLASVCDVCHFDLGEEDSYGVRIAKTEIATFLAEKSPTVKFEPIAPGKS